MRKSITISFLVLLLALAVSLAGCGTDSSVSSGDSGSGDQAVADLSADEILTKAQDASAGVTSMAMTADMDMTLDVDPAMADPSDTTAQQLAQGPVKLHVEGSVATGETPVMDMTASADAGGQSIPLGLKVDGDKVWLELQGQWYEVPADQSTQAVDTLNATPDKLMTDFGVDPMAWGEAEVAGTEEIDGAQCYHVTVAADPAKVASDLVEAMNSDQLQGLAGDQQATVDELKKQNAEAIEQVKQSLKTATAEYWVDTETFYVRKGVVNAEMAFSDPKATQGLKAASLNMSYTVSAFNEPVTVEPPADALPFEDLMGGLTGLSGGGDLGL